MPKKTISAGVIITDGEQLLLGHITNHVNWDIPKGQIDPGESATNAAVRECLEETGIQIPPHELHFLGLCAFKPKKDLMLYVWVPDKMPDPASCVCKSKFFSHKNTWETELDAFVCVPWDQVSEYCQPALSQLLKKVEPTCREHAQRLKSA